MKEKTLAFIDYANIKAWAREKGLSFDLEVLYEWLKTIWKARQISPNIQKALFQEIKELEKRRIRLLLPKANFDVEITLDLVLNKDRSERMLLFSGDSDFTTIVRYLRRSKKE